MVIKLSVRNFPKNAKIKDIKNFFAGIKLLFVKLDNYGAGCIEVKNEKSANEALKKDSNEFKNHLISVRIFHENETVDNKRSKVGEKKQKFPVIKEQDCIDKISDTGRLYLRNLNYDVTESDIVEMFKAYGNVSPYIASYMRIMTKSYTVKNADMVWIFAFAIAIQGLSMPLGGFLELKIGSRFTTLIGCFIMSLSVMLTYLTIQINLYATILTYGVTFGFGVGISYSVVLATTIKWFPENRGVVSGIVVAGFGLGSLIFNQIQTMYINPKNISPNYSTTDSDKYFTNNEILERVPNCFLLTGIIYASLQICAGLLLFAPPYSTINIVSSKIIDSTDCYENLLLKTDNTEEDDKELLSKDVNNLSIKKIFRQRNFWILWSIFVFLGTTNVFITSLYKTFGQLFIADDFYLAIVGSVASIFNASGRIFWGRIMDRFSYKVAIRCLIMNSLLLFGTFYLCSLISSSTGAKVMYMIWVCGIFGNICGMFAIMPVATSKLFGLNKIAILYGILFSSNAIAGILGATITSVLLSNINYLGIFEIGAGMLFITLILTFFHKSINF